MQFTNAILAIASMATLSSAAALPNTSELTARQSITLGECASVTSTLQTLIPDILFEHDGGLYGDLTGLLQGATTAVTINVYPLAGCVGEVTSTVVTDVDDVVTALIQGLSVGLNAIGDISFSITA